jgi:hypothetical protein
MTDPETRILAHLDQMRREFAAMLEAQALFAKRHEQTIAELNGINWRLNEVGRKLDAGLGHEEAERRFRARPSAGSDLARPSATAHGWMKALENAPEDKASGHWNYRLIERTDTNRTLFEVAEVYYDADGRPMGWCARMVTSESPEEVREVLAMMASAAEKPPLKESDFAPGDEDDDGA